MNTDNNNNNNQPRADESPSRLPSRPLPKRNQTSRGHVSQACERCRRLRGRCDGQLPCNACERASAPCEYAPRDRRGKADRPSVDTIDDLKVRKRVLDHIWHAIQCGEDDTILSTIRAGTPFPDFVRNVFGEETTASLQPDASLSHTVADSPDPSSQNLAQVDWSLEEHYLPSQQPQHSHLSAVSQASSQQGNTFTSFQHPQQIYRQFDPNPTDANSESSQSTHNFDTATAAPSVLFTSNSDLQYDSDPQQSANSSDWLKPGRGWTMD